MMRTLHTLSVISIVSALVSSCVTRPDALLPTAKDSQTIPKRYDASSTPVPEISNSLLKVFPDSKLRGLINTALKNNPDLKASAANLEEAGFNVRRSRSALTPSLTANSSSSRNSSNSPSFGRSTNENYSALLDSRWEVDVWGRIRSGVTAASSDQAAASADYATARQSIAAQSAQAYFALLQASSQLRLAERRLASFKKSYELVNRRFETGTSDLGSLDLARTDIETSRSQVALRKDQRDQAARRLSSLTGAYPDTSLSASHWPSLARSIPANLPSSLLKQRPDIDAAYQRIRAADSRVTVAHRDLYPSFTLTAGYGTQSNTLKQLANSNFNAWSLLANLSAPLIDGGARKAELGASNARAKRALANYQSTVLNAFREVENALGSERYLKQQFTATSNALKAAQSAEKRGLRNYDSGLITILDYLQIQRRTFSTEEALINIRAQRFQNRVTLALALGKAY